MALSGEVSVLASTIFPSLTVALYMYSSIADLSLPDVVIQIYFEIFPDLGWMRFQLELPRALERMDVFSSRWVPAFSPGY